MQKATAIHSVICRKSIVFMVAPSIQASDRYFFNQSLAEDDAIFTKGQPGLGPPRANRPILRVKPRLPPSGP